MRSSVNIFPIERVDPSGILYSPHLETSSHPSHVKHRGYNSPDISCINVPLKGQSLELPLDSELSPVEGSENHISISLGDKYTFSCQDSIESVIKSPFFKSRNFSWTAFFPLHKCPACRIQSDVFSLKNSDHFLNNGCLLHKKSLFILASHLLPIVHRDEFLTENEWSFDKFLASNDPKFILLRNQATSFWDKRVKKKRNKIAARDLFLEKMKAWNLEFLTPDRSFDSDCFDHFSIGKALRKWVGKPPDITLESLHLNFRRAEAWNFFNQSPKFQRGPSTQSWGRPPGINSILLNDSVKTFYQFQCGSNLCPINFVPGKDTSILSLSCIPDGVFINPPYVSPLLDKIISFLIKKAFDFRHVYAILVPFWESALWYRTLKALKTPCITLETPIYFLRGQEQVYANKANFRSSIFLVGAYTDHTSYHLKNDELGFPLETSYIEFFQHISFPANIGAKHGAFFSRNFVQRMSMILTFLQNAENSVTGVLDADITQHLRLDEIKKFNFLSQKVNDSLNVLDSHQWNFKLHPWIKLRCSWSSFPEKNRVFFTYKSGMEFLEKLQDSPKDIYAKKICRICKNRGHSHKFCHHRIPSQAELGLAFLGDKILYKFLEKLKLFKSDNLSNHFKSPNSFVHLAKIWLRREANFWSKWEKFAKSSGISDPASIIHEGEFSKGREALGWNYALGAQLPELLLDAFGATLLFASPPPPCEYVDDIRDGVPVYNDIPEDFQKEDFEEVRRRTQYILPKKYIQYILPRFVVVNTDLTRRSINDCQHMGPFTPVYRFRLPSPRSLRDFAPSDVILSVDGKSAYKQRKLAWSARNKIGFRTKINGVGCYVAMATPPFGLHNAGYIYQKALEAKMQRAAGSVLWLEYIDDVSIRIGSQDEPLEKAQWRAAAFIWILTKAGEILNDKFFVFKDIITMMGVHYNLRCDRFVPKLNSFYKFSLHIAKMLRKPALTLKDLEILTGKANWLTQTCSTTVLGPIYKYIGYLKAKHKPKNSREHKRLQSISIEWNRQILITIFKVLCKVHEAYSLFPSPNFSKSQKICYLVSDANPLVAGAYMAIGAATMEFEDIEPLNIESFSIANIPKSYIQKFELESVLHSTKSEAFGLLSYINMKFPILKRIAKKVDMFVVLGDNLALIQKLQKNQMDGSIVAYDVNKICELLGSLGTPICFRWLRRSRKPIALADSFGRKVSLYPKPAVIFSIEKFFDISIYTPKIFCDVYNIPIRLPDKLLAPVRSEQRVPFIAFPFNVTTDVFQIVIEAFVNAKLQVLVGVPYFNRRAIHAKLLIQKALSIPKITTLDFIGDEISERPRRNFPYIVAFSKPFMC